MELRHLRYFVAVAVAAHQHWRIFNDLGRCHLQQKTSLQTILRQQCTTSSFRCPLFLRITWTNLTE
jgi:hypothetical protein